MDKNPDSVQIIFFEAGVAGGSVNRLIKLLERWDLAAHPAGLVTFYDFKKARLLLQTPGLSFRDSFELQEQPLPDPVWRLGGAILPTRFGQGYFFKALKLLRRYPKAQVYLNNTPYSHLPLIAAAVLLERRVYCHLRDTINFTHLERLALPRLECCVALSRAAREHYLAQGLAPERIRVIYDSIDAELYAAPERSGAGPVRIAVTGTLNQRKGQDLCLRALEIVVRSHPSTQLVLVGDGELRGELAALAEELSLTSNVVFQGHSEEVSAILAGCDIGLLASRREGMPNSVMEYMASGLPVVVSDLPGIGELVLDGISGFVVPQESHLDLAVRLIQLIEAPELRRSMGCEGRARIRCAEFAPAGEVASIEAMVFGGAIS